MSWLKGESINDKLLDMHSYVEIGCDRDLDNQLGTGTEAQVTPFILLHDALLDSLYIGITQELEMHLTTGVFYELA
jgi:hypothetical protein